MNLVKRWQSMAELAGKALHVCGCILVLVAPAAPDTAHHDLLCKHMSLMLRSCMQHEVGVRNLEVLNNSTDAKGRELEVFKVHVPPPLFRTYKEAEGVHVSFFTQLAHA